MNSDTDPPRHDPTRCLVICHKQLGDLTLLEPSLAKLSGVYGGVDLLTRSGHAALVSLMPGVRMVQRPWLRKYAAVFSYDDLSKSAIHAFSIRAPRKDLLLRDPAELAWYHRLVFGSIHCPGIRDSYLARYNWDHTLSEKHAVYRAPNLLTPPDSWQPEGFDLRAFLLVNPTAGWKSKRWKVKGWIAVLEQVRRRDPDAPILITSGDQDWQIAHAQEIAQGLSRPVYCLGGRTRLEEFLWLVSRARMILGVDGAASHLAAAFHRPSLTLFFKANTPNWHCPGPSTLALTGTPSSNSEKLNLEQGDVAHLTLRLWNAQTVL